MMARSFLPPTLVASVLVLLLLTGGCLTTHGADGGTNAPALASDKSAPPEAVKSVFEMPLNKNQGRDPFNPNSNYPYDRAGGTVAGKTNTPISVDLVLKAIGGTPGNRLATINTRTFAKGDEGEMNTPNGRVQIHIVEIRDDAVVLKVNGEERELRFRRQYP